MIEAVIETGNHPGYVTVDTVVASDLVAPATGGGALKVGEASSLPTEKLPTEKVPPVNKNAKPKSVMSGNDVGTRGVVKSASEDRRENTKHQSSHTKQKKKEETP